MLEKPTNHYQIRYIETFRREALAKSRFVAIIHQK